MFTETDSNDQHVVTFCHNLKRLHLAETRGRVDNRLLHQYERDFIRNNTLDDDQEVRLKLRRKFGLGMDYFLGVKNTLLLWLVTWDNLLE